MNLSQLPFLGVGVGHRPELDAQIATAGAQVDWLEIISERYFGAAPDKLERLHQLRRRYPLVTHGVELSIGTEGPLDPGYVDSIGQLVSSVGAPWFSDHLCFTRAGGIALGQLTPVRRTREAARVVAGKARWLQQRVGIPLLLENITYYLDMEGELSEADFLCEVMSRCDCGLLLDLTNLFINSVNHGFDPAAWLDSIPLERTVQVHVAGGHQSKKLFLDTHGAPVHEEVWSLLGQVARRAPNLKAVLLERDQNFPTDFGDLARELDRARRVVAWDRRAD